MKPTQNIRGEEVGGLKTSTFWGVNLPSVSKALRESSKPVLEAIHPCYLLRVNQLFYIHNTPVVE